MKSYIPMTSIHVIVRIVIVTMQLKIKKVTVTILTITRISS